MSRFGAFLRLISGLFVLAMFYVLYLYARPAILFTYTHSTNGIAVYSTEPIDATTASPLLQSVSQTLAQSVLGPPEQEYSLFITGQNWRTSLFFWLAPNAGGVVYLPVTKAHGFLTGADFENDQLVKGEFVVGPPRTLSYYMAHELTHLRIGEMTGPLQYHRVPGWINEGLADYVALGAISDAEAVQILRWSGDHIQLLRTFGSYPEERVLVSLYLNTLGWSVRDLISSDISKEDAMIAASGSE